MKNINISIVLFLLVTSNISFGQSYVSGVIFTYDAKGNRLVRYIGTVCIGCPKPAIEDTSNVSEPQTEDVVENGIAIDAFPNPANTDLTVYNRTWISTDAALVVVTDIQGRTVVSRCIIQAKDVIPFAQLTPGIYMVNYFVNDRAVKTWRIIKL